MSKDPGYSDSRKDSQGSRLRNVEKKLEIALEALRYYASKDNYNISSNGVGYHDDYVVEDENYQPIETIAKLALAELGE